MMTCASCNRHTIHAATAAGPEAVAEPPAGTYLALTEYRSKFATELGLNTPVVTAPEVVVIPAVPSLDVAPVAPALPAPVEAEGETQL
jgi:hypothetical protein